MTKPHVTRTFGPIHFEDLDPHRFEDLVRHLVYDFRLWKSIESTGRGGADDGFDVRAFEELRDVPQVVDDELEAHEELHPMKGNVWMIQCKREKEVGPKKVASIVSEAVSTQGAPHGYILAAPVHFSKASHDRFREELRSRGVMEFYLWGAGELEDMLYQPKNDHILFAFFGISLVTKRRSRTGSVRSTVSAKNKLMRVLGEHPSESILVRDLNDETYPEQDNAPHFQHLLPWKDYQSYTFDPRGLVVTVARHFAYIDRANKQWDHTTTADVTQRHDLPERERALHLAAKGFWELLPRANRATWVRRELIRFDTIGYIDDKGDSLFKMPHLYVVFDPKRGPFSGYYETLEVNEHDHASLDGFTRKSIFPTIIPAPRFGIHHNHEIDIDDASRARLQYGRREVTLYGVEGQYAAYSPTDTVSINDTARNSEKQYVKFTSIQMMKAKDLIGHEVLGLIEQEVQRQIGRAVLPSENIRVVEAVAIYEWQIQQNRPVS